MEAVKNKVLLLLRSGPGTRLLLVLFLLLAIAVVFVGLDDTPGYVLGYLATTVLFLAMVRRWRSVKNYVILLLATLCIGVFLSGLYVEVISRIAVWMWGSGAVGSLPMRIIEWIVTYIILFGGPVGLILGFGGAVVLGILHLLKPGNREPAAD